MTCSILLRTLVLGIIFSPVFASAQQLCGTPKPDAQIEAPELRMFEHDFELEEAMKSISWLKEGVWELIDRTKTLEEFRSIDSGFPFRHHNTTTVVKGGILRQHAILRRERLEVATLKLRAGSGSKQGVESARKQYLAARTEFCKFLAESRWAD
jgi:hypothetical protein